MRSFLAAAIAASAFAIPAVASARTPRVAALQDAHGALRVFHIEGGTLYRSDQVTPNGGWSNAVMLESSVTGVTLAKNADGRLEAFYVAASQLYHAWQVSPGGSWSSGPFNVAAVDVAVGQHQDGRLDVFYVRPDGALYHSVQVAPSSTWLATAYVASNASEVVTGMNADGRLEVFWAGGTTAPIMHRWESSPNGSWSAAGSFPYVGSDLALGKNADGRFEFFFVDKANNQLSHIWQTAPSGGWPTTGEVFAQAGSNASKPTVGRNADGRLEVLYVDSFGNLGHAWQSAPNSVFSGPQQLGWEARSIASANNQDGRQEIFYIGAHGELFHDWQVEANRFWAGEYPLDNYQSNLVSMQLPLGAPVVTAPHPDWHINDHTIVRAPDGTFHLFGIFAQNPGISTHEFDDHVWLGHSSAPQLSGPWSTQSPPFYEAVVKTDGGGAPDMKAGAHYLWAPHVFGGPGNYTMVYCDGWDGYRESFAINMRTSPDLVTWSSPTNILTGGYQVRDPMVIRLADRWVLYYTATETNSGGHHTVNFVTSTDLVNWTPPAIAYMDFHWGADFGPTESPFVVQRGSYYYLFLGPRPYDAPKDAQQAAGDGLWNWEHPGYLGTDVFRSDRWDHWENANLVAHLPVHAAEVVKDSAGNSWITSGGINQGGVKMARLYWGDGFGP